MSEEEYSNLLKECPPSESPEFIEFLKDHNQIVEEGRFWIMIRNAKYDTLENPHYTIFIRSYAESYAEIPPQAWRALKLILERYSTWFIYSNAWEQKSIKRFHLQLTKSQILWLYAIKPHSQETKH